MNRKGWQVPQSTPVLGPPVSNRPASQPTRFGCRHSAPFALLLLLVALLPAQDDPLIAAAAEALAGRRLPEALLLLDGNPATAPPGRARLLLAQVRLAAGAPATAAALIGPSSALDRWPPAHRGAAGTVLVDAALAQQIDAPALLALLRQVLSCSPLPQRDRLLLVYAATAQASGDRAQARQALQTVWEGWPRSPHRPAAGLALAAELPADASLAVREILVTVRQLPQATAAQRGAAACALSALLLADRPGEALVVATRALKEPQAPPELHRWRALALAALEPVAGLAALDALPESERALLLVSSARDAALQAAARGGAIPVAQLVARARALADLGQVDEARALLDGPAHQDGEALAALVRLPGADPIAALARPAARQVQAAVALAAVLAETDPARAWQALAPALVPDALPPAEAWDWRRRLDPDVAGRAAAATALLALDQPGTATGTAWADEARRRERAGAPVGEAWVRAARALPEDHPWQAESAYRAGHGLAEAGAWSEAIAILTGPAWGTDTPIALRCRFLLAQAQMKTKAAEDARHTLEDLLARGDAAQQAKVRDLLESL